MSKRWRDRQNAAEKLGELLLKKIGNFSSKIVNSKNMSELKRCSASINIKWAVKFGAKQ